MNSIINRIQALEVSTNLPTDSSYIDLDDQEFDLVDDSSIVCGTVLPYYINSYIYVDDQTGEEIELYELFGSVDVALTLSFEEVDHSIKVEIDKFEIKDLTLDDNDFEEDIDLFDLERKLYLDIVDNGKFFDIDEIEVDVINRSE